MAMMRSRYFVLLFTTLVVAFSVCFFSPKTYSWESYLYAAATEGIFDISSLFMLFQPSGATQLSGIADYHPNHPLSHAIIGLLHRDFSMPALESYRALNSVAAILFAVAFFLTAELLGLNIFTAAVTTLLITSTHVFLGNSISGDVQLFSIALQITALYFLLHSFKNTVQRRPNYLFAAAALLVFAGAFHLSAIIFLFPILVFVYVERKQISFKYFIASCLIVIGGYIFFYIVLFVPALHIHNLIDYLRTLFIYSYLPSKKFAIAEWPKTVMESFSFALFSTSTSAIMFAAVVILVFLMGIYIIRGKNNSRSAFIFITMWLFTWQFFAWILRGRPDAVNGYISFLPPLFLVIGFAIQKISIFGVAKILIVVFLMLWYTINFRSTILPKYQANSTDFYFNIPSTPTDVPLAIYVINNLHNTMADIWYNGTKAGWKKQKHIFLCCDHEVPERIEKLVRENKRAVLIFDSDTPILKTLITRRKIQLTKLGERSAFIPREWIQESVIYPIYQSAAFEKKQTYYTASVFSDGVKTTTPPAEKSK